MYRFIRRAILMIPPMLAVLLASGFVMPGVARATISFLPPVTYTKAGAAEMKAADMDGDGKIDLVVAGTDGVSILFGRGDGTFDQRVDIPLGSGLGLANHMQMALADVNGDGAKDLIIPIFSLNKVVVLLNLGRRSFAPAVSYAVGANPDSLVTGDFNNDGRPDVAVSNLGDGTLAVLLNRGNGTFQAPVVYPGIGVAGGLTAADFNADGNLDLAMSTFYGGTCMLYLGDGTGKFPGGGRFQSGGETPARITTDDFNGDGWPDVATSNYHSGNVSILLGDGSGTLAPASTFPANQYPFDVVAADLDGDGHPDLVTVDATLDYFTVLENAATGSFLPALQFSSGGTGIDGVAVGDFNGDGLPDVAVGNSGSNTIAVLINSSPHPTPAVLSLLVDAASVVGGCQTINGTVTLTAPAPAGGTNLLLTNTNAAIKAPAGVTVSEGATQAGFVLSAAPVGTVAAGTVTVSMPGSAKQVSLTVRPGGTALLKLAPAALIGGGSVSGEVDLVCPAGPQGTTVVLASSRPDLLPAPATVIVPPGATHVSFSLPTQRVTAETAVTLTATFDGFTRTADVVLHPVPPPPPPPPPVNLLVNGSFEDPDASGSSIGWLTYGPAGIPGRMPVATSIPGWKITQGTVDVTSWYWKAAVGRQSLDLVGDNPGTIEQSFATNLGKEYVLSGVIAHNPGNFFLAEGRGNVFVNHDFLTQLIHHDEQVTVSDMHWTPFSVRFRATSATTTLTISDATGTPFPGGLVLDGLAVTPTGG